MYVASCTNYVVIKVSPPKGLSLHLLSPAFFSPVGKAEAWYLQLPKSSLSQHLEKGKVTPTMSTTTNTINHHLPLYIALYSISFQKDGDEWMNAPVRCASLRFTCKERVYICIWILLECFHSGRQEVIPNRCLTESATFSQSVYPEKAIVNSCHWNLLKNSVHPHTLSLISPVYKLSIISEPSVLQATTTQVVVPYSWKIVFLQWLVRDIFIRFKSNTDLNLRVLDRFLPENY